MNRIDRLSAILIQLQSRPLVKAQDIADRFSISLRTVYRDVKALEEGGVPIIGEAGTGYRLMEGYKLPPIHFNQEEASALLTGAKLMQSMSDAPTAGYYQSALDKIRAVLRLTEKHQMANLDDHIAVVAHPTFVYSKPTELHLSKILQAIAANLILELTHTSASRTESLRRNVEPIGIYYQGSHWYLVAYCHLRREYRNFRTDRISRLRLTEEKMTQSHPPLQNFLSRVTEKKNLEKVVIEVNASIAKYFGEQKYYNGFVTEEKRGDKVRMTFLTSCLSGFSRWFLLYADEATILEPQELQEIVTAHAEKILQKLEINKALLT